MNPSKIDVFASMPSTASSPLPSSIGSRTDHPAPRLGINQAAPIPTNKFYANLFLGNQDQAIWTHPYSLWWAKGSGNAKSHGLCIGHTDESQLVFGPGDPAPYYFNPIKIQSIILSAVELGSSTALSMDTLTSTSANLNFLPSEDAVPAFTVPLVQGMGFVTGVYTGSRPQIQSSVFFRKVTLAEPPRAGITKYKMLLEDGNTWVLYATPTGGHAFQLKTESNTLLRAMGGFTGTIQIAKVPRGSADGEAVFDASAGVYATSNQLSAWVTFTEGAYIFTFTKAGLSPSSTPLLMFALPHHLQSLSPQTTSAKVTSVQLRTTTKGLATAILGDSWTMSEPSLPAGLSFAPWSPNTGSLSIPPELVPFITFVAKSELLQDFSGQTNLDSMYFSGKALSKFAMLVYTTHSLLHNPSLAAPGLAKLKDALKVFIDNRQRHPLVYERAWGGVVSSASYTTGDAGADFGNTYYNDHHFHWGYFIYTAAVIAHIDPSWLSEGENRKWVNMLVRDAAFIGEDGVFPAFRAFDWFHGHSWAKGLFESWDGKDEESSSEDAFFAYAVKLWGEVCGNEGWRGGDLMLAILRRSLGSYFLMDTGNVNHPARFVKNRVTGILFENKCDHATYFGNAVEFIQGIHMIPLAPVSAYIRSPSFVRTEWQQYFSDGRVDNVQGGWRGILYANWALVDPEAAWRFFAREDFDMGWLDGGASRAWYLAWCAALGGGR